MNKKAIDKIYSEKINQLKKYNKAYFEHDRPIVSDIEYDNLKKKLYILKKNIFI